MVRHSRTTCATCSGCKHKVSEQLAVIFGTNQSGTSMLEIPCFRCLVLRPATIRRLLLVVYISSLPRNPALPSRGLAGTACEIRSRSAASASNDGRIIQLDAGSWLGQAWHPFCASSSPSAANSATHTAPQAGSTSTATWCRARYRCAPWHCQALTRSHVHNKAADSAEAGRRLLMWTLAGSTMASSPLRPWS